MSSSRPSHAQFRPEVSVLLAARYLVTRGSALSYISRLALLGLILSVAILVIVLSVVNGFERELRERVLSLLPHVSVFAAQGLQQEDVNRILQLTGAHGIEGGAAIVQGSVLLVANGRLQGTNLLGVDEARYDQVTRLQDHLQVADGSQPASLAVLSKQPFGIILGKGLAAKLGVGPDDTVLVVMASGSITPAGIVPRQRRFTVTGIINSQSQLDSQFAYISLPTAQKLFRSGNRVHGLHIKVADLFNTLQAEVAIGDLDWDQTIRVSSWQRNFGNGNLYQAIAVQKATMFVLLSFLVAVAAFNLVSGLTMIVEQRQPDIAILRTMGASFFTLLAGFALLGLLLAVSGILLGLLIGYLIATSLPVFYQWINANFQLDLMSQYFISYLPVDVRGYDLLTIALASLVLAACAILAPAIRAARARPSLVLAHE